MLQLRDIILNFIYQLLLSHKQIKTNFILIQPKLLSDTDQYSLTNMASTINIFLVALILIPTTSSTESNFVNVTNEVKELRALFQEIQASISEFQGLKVRY